MKFKKFHYLHPIAILFILITSRLIIAFLSTTNCHSTSTTPFFINTLFVALLLQSFCVSYMAPKQKKTGFWITADIAITSALLFTIIIITVLSSQAYQQSLIGLLVAVSFVLRSVFLISLISSISNHLSNKTIHFAVAAVLISLIIPVTSWRIIIRPLQGDEPFYLLITYSLIHDQDINLENNYLHGDSLAYSQTRLSPQLFDNYKEDKLISRHPPFLPFLLIPSFLVAKATGTLFFMMLFSIALAFGLIRLMAQCNIPTPLRVCAACIVVLSAPIVFYTPAIFIELPAAALGVIILSLCIDLSKIQLKTFLLTVILILTGVFLKTRLVFLYLPPIITSLLIHRRLKKITWIGILTMVLFAISFFNLVLFGSILGRYFLQDLTRLSAIRAFRGIFGLFWDQQYGLFPMNLLYLLSLPGIYYLYQKHNKSHLLIWASAIAPYFMMIAFYAELSGGHCPKGRFLIAWAPLLALPVAVCFNALKRNMAITIFVALSALSFPATLLLIAFPDWQLTNPGGTDRLLTVLSQSLHTDILGIIPSFDRVEEGFVRNALLLSGCALLLSIFIIIANKLKFFLSCRNPVVLGLCFSLLTLVVCLGCFQNMQSSWMHMEDFTFEHTDNSGLFWEEPFYWDQTYPPSPSPYISGIRLGPGGSTTRKLPLRKPSSTPEITVALEIVARASYPQKTIPTLEIIIGHNLYQRIPIKSTDFQSYFVPWPFGAVSLTPPIKFQFSSNNHSETFIDIDKIRLAAWDKPWPEIHPDEQLSFPIRFGPLTLVSMNLPENPPHQGQAFDIQPIFSVEKAINDLHIELLFLAETRAYTLTIDPSHVLENRAIQTVVPVEIGAGVFNVLMSVCKKNEPDTHIFPEGQSAFLSGNRAWVGNIEILTSPITAVTEWNDLALNVFSTESSTVIFMPEVCHLSKNQQANLVLEEPVYFNELIIISHLSSVFEQMPWETHVGDIIINPSQSAKTLPIILGRHTAEALYEFGGKAVRLPHPQAPIATRSPETLLWPKEFKGMVYNAVYYKYKFVLDTPVTVKNIKLNANEIPGVWNVFTIGLISES